MRSEWHRAELQRQLARVVAVGIVDEIDHEVSRARIRVGDATTPWLPWMVARAGSDVTWWPPVEGEQVLMVAPDGEWDNGLILGSIYQASSPAPSDKANELVIQLGDGTEIRYDRGSHSLSAKLAAGGSAEIDAPGGVTIKGDLTVQGNVSATGDVSDGTRAMSGDRMLHNAHTHDAPPGGGKTTTATPTQ